MSGRTDDEAARWLGALNKIRKIGTTLLDQQLLQCTEEGCPPIETVIAIMETPGKPRQYKIHKPLAEVKQTDIVSLTAG